MIRRKTPGYYRYMAYNNFSYAMELPLIPICYELAPAFHMNIIILRDCNEQKWSMERLCQLTNSFNLLTIVLLCGTITTISTYQLSSSRLIQLLLCTYSIAL